ncbi:UDP-N-acetylglucosamine--undecaprenyl-phosphate N-acetylglucosaminephosphotransferase [Pseudoalteromonas pernae]|uniref:UDP-N-acetylglucosamine--undecaprenyl-phosphate N-acetylglucosaminephosphotransferase n=1 Tax=Pseudoalteromonas pernae TaxID=3118054 RepID=UPI003241C6E1
MLANTLGIFIGSFLSLFFFRKVAVFINLVDEPNARKHHQGAVPLVGGLSVFVVVFSFLCVFPETITSSYLYLVCAGALLLAGVLDDLYDISFKLRLVLQFIISGLMMSVGHLVLQDVGELIGPFSMGLGYFGYLATAVVVVGAINAFNMVDGIDGLLGALSTITFSALGVLFYVNGQHELTTFCLIIVVATIPYIFMNLGIPLGQRFKIFMGDAGSTVIGFTVVWLLLEGSQQQELSAFSPVTALWVAAVPIMDAVTTIARRIKKGHSPFRPDREHLHHILLRLGLSPRQALLAIFLVALFFATVGVLAEVLDWPQYVMFWAFCVITFIYFYIMSRIWRISVLIRRRFNIEKRSRQANKK